MSTIKYHLAANSVVTITFDRDEKRNAITHEMAEEILRCLDRAECDQARVIILRANPGVTVWCAGHDLAELDPEALDTEHPTLQVFGKIQSTPIPVVAMVEGSVHAAGLIMLICADLVIATHDASVAIASNKMGIPLEPELYAFWLRVMGMHKTKELFFTASNISAQDAYQAGLYNHLVGKDDLDYVTSEIVNQILLCAADCIANTKYQLNLLAQQSALAAEQRANIRRRNAELLGSQATRDRISALLASLRRL